MKTDSKVPCPGYVIFPFEEGYSEPILIHPCEILDVETADRFGIAKVLIRCQDESTFKLDLNYFNFRAINSWAEIAKFGKTIKEPFVIRQENFPKYEGKYADLYGIMGMRISKEKNMLATLESPDGKYYM